MIFSLLKIRKKTAAVLAGIACGLACVWVVASWQQLTLEELLGTLLGSIFLLAGIMLVAACLVVAFTLFRKLLQKINGAE